MIDAGHQSHAMTGAENQESIGPGSTETKDKVTSGTTGVYTGYNEYELNLEVALKLKTILQSRGYKVYMTRETNDVQISNIERTEIANMAEADVLIHIHANWDETSSQRGAFTICQTSNSIYNSNIYSDCRLLSECVLDGFCNQTGFSKCPIWKNDNMENDIIWETDSMTGINWSEVPVTIIEMGYMSNAEEDIIMSKESFWINAATGIANGIDAYISLLDK